MPNFIWVRTEIEYCVSIARGKSVFHCTKLKLKLKVDMRKDVTLQTQLTDNLTENLDKNNKSQGCGGKIHKTTKYE